MDRPRTYKELTVNCEKPENGWEKFQSTAKHFPIYVVKKNGQRCLVSSFVQVWRKRQHIRDTSSVDDSSRHEGISSHWETLYPLIFLINIGGTMYCRSQALGTHQRKYQSTVTALPGHLCAQAVLVNKLSFPWDFPFWVFCFSFGQALAAGLQKWIKSACFVHGGHNRYAHANHLEEDQKFLSIRYGEKFWGCFGSSTKCNGVKD